MMYQPVQFHRNVDKAGIARPPAHVSWYVRVERLLGMPTQQWQLSRFTFCFVFSHGIELIMRDVGTQ